MSVSDPGRLGGCVELDVQLVLRGLVGRSANQRVNLAVAAVSAGGVNPTAQESVAPPALAAVAAAAAVAALLHCRPRHTAAQHYFML